MVGAKLASTARWPSLHACTTTNNFILVLWQDYIDQENRIESINSVLNKSNRTMGKIGNQKAPGNDSKCEGKGT